MNENPLYGVERLNALANQQTTPRNGVERQVSPTGEPYLPPRWVGPLMTIHTALTGLAGYLVLFEENALAKKVGIGIGLALAVLGSLLGQASPGWRRGVKVLVALLAVGLAAPAMAAPVRRAVLLEGLDAKAQHIVAVGAGEETPASPWSLFAVGPGFGVDVRAGKVSPVAELLGTLALTRVFGQVLSLGAGGSLLTWEELRTGFVAGLALDLPGPEGSMRPCLFVGAAFIGGGVGTRIAIAFPGTL